MRLAEHWCGLKVDNGFVLRFLAVSDSQAVFKISCDPHLADDLFIQGHIGRLKELEKEPRR